MHFRIGMNSIMYHGIVLILVIVVLENMFNCGVMIFSNTLNIPAFIPIHLLSTQCVHCVIPYTCNENVLLLVPIVN